MKLQSRSKTNFKEADMVVALAVFFQFQKRGIKPTEITILTPYLGQTKVRSSDDRHVPRRRE